MKKSPSLGNGLRTQRYIWLCQENGGNLSGGRAVRINKFLKGSAGLSTSEIVTSKFIKKLEIGILEKALFKSFEIF